MFYFFLLTRGCKFSFKPDPILTEIWTIGFAYYLIKMFFDHRDFSFGNWVCQCGKSFPWMACQHFEVTSDCSSTFLLAEWQQLLGEQNTLA